MGKLTAVMPSPGIFTEGTRYASEGRWFDGQWIRWRKGFPEAMGGWITTGVKPWGVCRKIHDWGTVTGQRYLGLGTTYKLYIDDSGAIYDVTPQRPQFTLGADPISTTNGTALVEITVTSHEAVAGDYVTLAGATTTNGIADTDINQEHRIQGIVDGNTIQIVMPTAATSTGTGGGSSITADFQINIGLDTYVPGSGWGAGSWGSGAWGGASSLSPASQLRIWSIDNYGDDLIACVRTGGIYYWDETNGLSTRAIPFSDLPRRTVTLETDPLDSASSSAVLTINDFDHGCGVGDTVVISGATGFDSLAAGDINGSRVVTEVLSKSQYTVNADANAGSGASGGGSAVQIAYPAGVYWTPNKAMQIMTSPTARHIIAFGCNRPGETDLTQLQIRWCSAEAPAIWEPTDENTAGDYQISTGSQYVGALRTRQEIVIWTDVGMVSMRYIGRPFVFSFTDIEGGNSMISPNAAVEAAGRIYYMDRGGFYVYAGGVQRVPCAVRDYVFSRIDLNNAFKVHAGANQDFSEVIWFYPSTDGDGRIDSYVKFNYDENLWDYGNLARGAWANAPTKTEPRASEIGIQDLGTNPLAVTSGDETMTVTATNHGLSPGDEVIFSGSGSLGGIDADVINSQYAVATVTDSDTFTVELPDTPASNETGGGGTTTIIKPMRIYAHEVGYSADGEALDAYVECADVDIEDGENFMFVSRIVPDVAYRGDSSQAELTMEVKFHDFPGEDQRTPISVTLTPTTKQKHVRGRGRQMSYKLSSSGVGWGWRMGKMRFDTRLDGRR